MYDFSLRTELEGEAELLGIRRGRCPSIGGDKASKLKRGSVPLLKLDFEDMTYDTVIAGQYPYTEFDLHSLLFSPNPVRAYSNFQKALDIARKSKSKIIVSTRARDRYELRSESDTRTFLQVLGMTPEEAKRATRDNPAELAREASKRKIREGVEYEE